MFWLKVRENAWARANSSIEPAGNIEVLAKLSVEPASSLGRPPPPRRPPRPGEGAAGAPPDRPTGGVSPFFLARRKAPRSHRTKRTTRSRRPQRSPQRQRRQRRNLRAMTVMAAIRRRPRSRRRRQGRPRSGRRSRRRHQKSEGRDAGRPLAQQAAGSRAAAGTVGSREARCSLPLLQ